MDKYACELLALLLTYETIHRPELIPSPQAIRIDPKFSDALDYLLDCGYVKVEWKADTDLKPDLTLIEADDFDPSMEALGITREGIDALHNGFTCASNDRHRFES